MKVAYTNLTVRGATVKSLDPNEAWNEFGPMSFSNPQNDRWLFHNYDDTTYGNPIDRKYWNLRPKGWTRLEILHKPFKWFMDCKISGRRSETIDLTSHFPEYEIDQYTPHILKYRGPLLLQARSVFMFRTGNSTSVLFFKLDDHRLDGIARARNKLVEIQMNRGTPPSYDELLKLGGFTYDNDK